MTAIPNINIGNLMTVGRNINTLKFFSNRRFYQKYISGLRYGIVLLATIVSITDIAVNIYYILRNYIHLKVYDTIIYRFKLRII